VSLTTRDRDAFELARSRSFGDAYVASIDLELQARRLTVRSYGALRRGERGTFLGTMTFFGAGDLRLENAVGAFPESVAIAGFALDYDDATDRGSAELRGRQSWTLAWTFDGLAYEEHAAVLASLADELPGDP
jgi:hypothetical protein